MELQINGAMVFNGVLSLAVFFIGLWFKRLESDLKEHKDDIVRIKDTYQSKELARVQGGHVDEMMREIRNELRSINQKLDSKEDKK
jgi:hypothetical protein